MSFTATLAAIAELNDIMVMVTYKIISSMLGFFDCLSHPQLLPLSSKLQAALTALSNGLASWHPKLTRSFQGLLQRTLHPVHSPRTAHSKAS